MPIITKRYLKNKSVLITGVGSFGKNLVKFLLENFHLKKIIIFSRDEFKQFEMEKEFIKHKKILIFYWRYKRFREIRACNKKYRFCISCSSHETCSNC